MQFLQTSHAIQAFQTFDISALYGMPKHTFRTSILGLGGNPHIIATDTECELWLKYNVAFVIMYTAAFDLSEKSSRGGMFPRNLNKRERQFLYERVRNVGKGIISWWRDVYFTQNFI